jgi:hypothetical protein
MLSYDDARYSEPIVDHEEVSELEELVNQAKLKFLDFLAKRDKFVLGYSGNTKFAFECTLLALGEDYCLGDGKMNASKLAAKWGVSRAAVVRIMRDFQITLNLPPAEHQRNKETIRRNKQARLKVLKK